MARAFYSRKVFSARDVRPEPDAELEHCQLDGCDFARFVWDGAEFAHCSFSNCDLAMAVLDGVALHQSVFQDCKLIGVDFAKCSQYQFSVTFRNCILDYAQFDHHVLKEMLFENCQLREVSFNECNLTGARFVDCDLDGASFTRCNLEGADFRSARNYTLDPAQNRLKNARFSLPGVLSLLAPLRIRIDE